MLEGKITFKPTIAVLAVLVLWFVIVTVSSIVAAFRAAADAPTTNLMLAIVLPVALFACAYRLSAAFRTWVKALDLGIITTFHAWRIVGLVFLILYADDRLPGLFAWPAGLGDDAIALAAPFIGAVLIAGRPVSSRRLIAFNGLGLLDFAVAVTLGTLTNATPIGVLAGAVASNPVTMFPRNLIPTFAVPMFVILHVITLIRVADDRLAVPLGRSV